MKTILSTKKLSLSQRDLLLHAGFALVEYDAIKIDFIPFEIPLKIENAIFTSQNAVTAFFESSVRSSAIDTCFCVGEKTKHLLESKGCRVLKATEYASELADFIVKNHKWASFHFFCGNIRSDEIPSKLKANNIIFEEIEVYKTTLTPKKFERKFDGILFFSPSGVQSFFAENTNGGKAVCIGKTTASEAKKYIENVAIANATTVESVIAKAVKILKN